MCPQTTIQVEIITAMVEKCCVNSAFLKISRPLSYPPTQYPLNICHSWHLHELGSSCCFGLHEKGPVDFGCFCPLKFQLFGGQQAHLLLEKIILEARKHQTESEDEEKQPDQLCLIKRYKAVFHKNVPKNKNRSRAMQQIAKKTFFWLSDFEGFFPCLQF